MCLNKTLYFTCSCNLQRLEPCNSPPKFSKYFLIGRLDVCPLFHVRTYDASPAVYPCPMGHVMEDRVFWRSHNPNYDIKGWGRGLVGDSDWVEIQNDEEGEVKNRKAADGGEGRAFAATGRSAGGEEDSEGRRSEKTAHVGGENGDSGGLSSQVESESPSPNSDPKLSQNPNSPLIVRRLKVEGWDNQWWVGATEHGTRWKQRKTEMHRHNTAYLRTQLRRAHPGIKGRFMTVKRKVMDNRIDEGWERMPARKLVSWMERERLRWREREKNKTKEVGKGEGKKTETHTKRWVHKTAGFGTGKAKAKERKRTDSALGPKALDVGILHGIRVW